MRGERKIKAAQKVVVALAACFKYLPYRGKDSPGGAMDGAIR
jgi:hypothetical protein